tara:strand:+ start:39 stop:266 length:228 start_codon:yes stop_codon:yes gene_type:complete
MNKKNLITKKQILQDLFRIQLVGHLKEHTVEDICYMIEQVHHEAWEKGFKEGYAIWKDVLADDNEKVSNTEQTTV